jgi:DnaK suppressor protein
MARKDSLSAMREVLLKRREALRLALAGDLSMLRQMNEQSGGDVIDFALDTAQGELNTQLAEVESRELAAVQNAIKKLDDGTYGKCEACNTKIPMARLQALPYAILCIDCQRQVEEMGTHHGILPDWGDITDINNGDEMRFGDYDVNLS